VVTSAAGQRRRKSIFQSIFEAIRVMRSAAPTSFSLAAGCQIAGGATLALQLLFARRVVAGLIVPRGQIDLHHIVPPLLIALVAGAASILADQLRLDQQRLLGERTGRYVIDRVLESASRAPLIRFEEPEFHDRLRRAQIDSLTRPGEIASGVLGLCSSLAALCAIGIAMAAVGFWFLLAVVVATIPALLASNHASKLSYRFEVAQTPNYRERAYLLLLLLGRDSAKELRSYDTAARFRTRNARLHEERISALRDMAWRRAMALVLGTVVTTGVMALVVVHLVHEVANGTFAADRAIVAVGALILASTRLSALATSITSIGESARFFDDLNAFVAEGGADRGLSFPAPTAAASVDVRSQTLRLEGVSFRYPQNDRPALDAVDLVVEPGEIVALVGENGSGKTTLVKIACGLYLPDSGIARLGNQELDEASATWWRRQFAVVFQDYVRYYLSAAEIISLGRDEGAGDRAGITDAARRVAADAFIARLPDGYDTRLGPEFIGGTDISGGEWQRMALARALYRDAPFVVFDEPSAALDPRAEAALFHDVRKLVDGRGALLVSHRFSAVRNADRIYVLEQGRVRESGSHDELMARGDRYAELFTLQAASYQDQTVDAVHANTPA
jgi:ATP-binding cassette subfamily B protein